MCLDKITEKYKKSKSGIGYKVFNRNASHPRGRKIHFWCKEYRGSTVVPLGEWLEAERIENGIRLKYFPGFHIFPTLAAAREWNDYGEFDTVIVQVRYRGARLEGIDCGARVLVADEMFVPMKYQRFPQKRQ